MGYWWNFSWCLLNFGGNTCFHVSWKLLWAFITSLIFPNGLKAYLLLGKAGLQTLGKQLWFTKTLMSPKVGNQAFRGCSFLLGRAKGKSHWKPGKSPEYCWFSEGKLGSNLKGGFSSFKPCSWLPEWYMNKSTTGHHELQWSHASIAIPKTPTSLSVCKRQISNCRFITGWWFEPLWNIWKSIGMMTFPILMGKLKSCSSYHQPVLVVLD